jgi:pyruvate-ferredoxin/flavodoxin oxidoreductase
MESENWEYAMTVTEKKQLLDTTSVKGSQFARPLLEFNGACPGCGETPYIRLLTQLYGERMMIANATGCSSIWGASAPSIPYTTNADGKGPSWGNSLFEDNAEYGYGMYLGVRAIREKLLMLMKEGLALDFGDDVKKAFKEWIENYNSGEGSKIASDKILSILNAIGSGKNKVFDEILEKKDYLVKKSQWIIGGDGWAYDIGYGGVDQVISTGDDVNIFVMDTEIYSNTGGQSSKSTPTGAVAKFAASGKKIRKKDLGMMAMSYGYVYVAQIAMGANMAQTLNAIREAESYNGPSLIIAYAPCISHGIKSGMGTSIMEQKKAVNCGYWHLYRFNPHIKKQGDNPFVLDSKEPTESFLDFINGEIRYASLKTTFPEISEKLFPLAEENNRERYENYKRMASQKYK